MEIPAPTTNFVGLTVTLTETQRKAAINSRYQSSRDARELEDWLDAQRQRFAMLGINVESYNAIVWVTSQYSEPQSNWWLNRKHKAAIPHSFGTLVEEIRKTSLLPNIRDDTIYAQLELTQGNLSYADYTQLFDVFYGGLDNLLQMTFNTSNSFVGLLIFNFRLKLGPITLNRGVTLYP
jgi:hypothetical protein